MPITRPKRSAWARPEMLSGTVAALIGAYGLAPRYGLAADIPYELDGSRFQMAATITSCSAPRSRRCCGR